MTRKPYPLTCDKCDRVFATVYDAPKAWGWHDCKVTKRKRKFRYHEKESK